MGGPSNVSPNAENGVDGLSDAGVHHAAAELVRWVQEVAGAYNLPSV